MKTIQIVSEFKKKVSDQFGKVEIILFGSRARGDAANESDIDIFVILNRNADIELKESIYDIAYEISLEYDVVLDVIVYSREEWDRYRGALPFIINVEKESVVV